MIQQVENPIIEIHDVSVSYEKKTVLWDIDLTIPKGSLCGIVGPNGAGKSTLIKAIMGLVPINSGYIKLFDQDLNKVRKKISYIPQKETVDWDFPISVMDIVLMGRYPSIGLFKKPNKNDKKEALLSLKKVGMEAYSKRQISQLSGGQQQRVFLARALTQNAEIYLMDEPFAGIDATTENTIIDLLKQLSKSGKTIIVVHHDLHSVQNYFDWLIMLNLHLIASSNIKDAFTKELLEKTYGGNLSILTKVDQLIKKKQFKIREKH